MFGSGWMSRLEEIGSLYGKDAAAAIVLGEVILAQAPWLNLPSFGQGAQVTCCCGERAE